MTSMSLAVVDVVAKPGCVDDIESAFETFFFQARPLLRDANLNGLCTASAGDLGVGISLESG